MIKVFPYRKGEANKVNPNPLAFTDLNTLGFIDRVDNAYFSNPSVHVYSVKYKEKILCVFAWYELWSGVAELVAIVDKLVQEDTKIGFAFAREMKNFIENEIAIFNLVRIQTTLRSKYDDGANWLLFLGMEKEGTLRKFCEDRSDCDIWARVED